VVATTDGYQLALRVTVFLGLAAALLIAVVMEKVTVVEPDQQAIAEGDAPERLMFVHVGSMCSAQTCPQE
jgi:hypothetical protein